MAHQHNINPVAAQALVAEIRSQWPTGALLEWVVLNQATDPVIPNGFDGVHTLHLFDGYGEHVTDGPNDDRDLQEIVDRHAAALGWPEADIFMGHYFYLPEARDVSYGENGGFETGFSHPGLEFLAQGGL